eukprot:1078819-Pleurochrysis_carterae.AAC.1
MTRARLFWASRSLARCWAMLVDAACTYRRIQTCQHIAVRAICQSDVLWALLRLQTLARNRRILVHAASCIVHRQLVLSWRAWGEGLDLSKKKRAQLRRAALRFRQSESGPAFRQWASRSESRSRYANLVGKIVMIWKSRQVSGAWRRWADEVQSFKNALYLLCAARQRRLLRKNMQAMRRWRDNAASISSHFQRLTLAASYWGQQARRRALSQIRIERVASEHLDKLLGKTTRIIKQRNLTSTFARWKEYTRPDQLSERAQRALKTKNRQRGFQAWKKRTLESLKQRALKSLVLRRVMQRQLFVCMTNWKDALNKNEKYVAKKEAAKRICIPRDLSR